MNRTTLKALLFFLVLADLYILVTILFEIIVSGSFLENKLIQKNLVLFIISLIGWILVLFFKKPNYNTHNLNYSKEKFNETTNYIKDKFPEVITILSLIDKNIQKTDLYTAYLVKWITEKCIIWDEHSTYKNFSIKFIKKPCFSSESEFKLFEILLENSEDQFLCFQDFFTFNLENEINFQSWYLFFKKSGYVGLTKMGMIKSEKKLNENGIKFQQAIYNHISYLKQVYFKNKLVEINLCNLPSICIIIMTGLDGNNIKKYYKKEFNVNIDKIRKYIKIILNNTI